MFSDNVRRGVISDPDHYAPEKHVVVEQTLVIVLLETGER